MHILAITQARVGSTRLPEKILKTIKGETLLEIHMKRVLQSRLISKLKVATTIEPHVEKIVAVANKLGVEVYKGSVNNVLDRFYQTALPEKPDWVVRLTSDCPLIDPVEIDKVIQHALDNDLDYVSNALEPTFPDGLDTEVFKFSALEKAFREAKMTSDLEHVTPFIWKNSSFKGGTIFSSDCVMNEKDFSGIRLTVDTLEDFLVIEKLVELLGTDKPWLEYVRALEQHPEIQKLNEQYKRNEGYEKSLKKDTMGKGQELYKKAKTLIPGGTMLLSKRPEMFLPEQWPAYFSKAKGCKVWDLDGNEYTDVSIMGIGTNILGYGNDEVDEAVIRTVQTGNMSTFNCPEEVALAEKLVELHPWADMVRFARSGGEANAIAIRIARAASGKDKVAICGYHGWHDWYLSANLGDEQNLAGHLLPGLEPAGVPKNLSGTTLPFNYNNIQELYDLVNRHDIGVIKMEVTRNMGPEVDFLQKVRQLATERNIVLIFDECTSGFRQTFGGIHKLYGVEPDMAMFGKALGNGYAITTTIGKRSVMEAAQKTFISSTFWTERIGPTAALATLKVMERIKSWETITHTGLEIKKRWQQLADKHQLSISQWGLPALTGFSFNSEKNLAYKTYITQEMLSKGYLAGNSIYVSIAHTPEILEGYFLELDRLFADVREFEDGRDVMALLKGPVCHGGFKRLN
jgi:glutamate-1-semialdehyde 2,1-aminomutase